MANFCPVGWVDSVSPNAGGRFSYYGVTTVPRNVFDGEFHISGGNYTSYNNMYTTRKAVPSPLTVEFLTKSYAGNTACVSVKVRLEESIAEGTVVHIYLWEDRVVGGSHTWRFVQRGYAGYEALTITQPGQEQIIKKTFTLGSTWKRADLGATVIVQRLVAKTIYNGNATKLVEGVGVSPTSLGRVKALYQ